MSKVLKWEGGILNTFTPDHSTICAGKIFPYVSLIVVLWLIFSPIMGNELFSFPDLDQYTLQKYGSELVQFRPMMYEAPQIPTIQGKKTYMHVYMPLYLLGMSALFALGHHINSVLRKNFKLPWGKFHELLGVIMKLDLVKRKEVFRYVYENDLMYTDFTNSRALARFFVLQNLTMLLTLAIAFMAHSYAVGTMFTMEQALKAIPNTYYSLIDIPELKLKTLVQTFWSGALVTRHLSIAFNIAMITCAIICLLECMVIAILTFTCRDVVYVSSEDKENKIKAGKYIHPGVMMLWMYFNFGFRALRVYKFGSVVSKNKSSASSTTGFDGDEDQ